MTDHPGDLISKYHRDEDVYFLLGYDDQGNILACDGGHSDVAGVAEALELHKRLWPNGIGGKKVAFYKMAIYTSVPEFTGTLNEEAIASCTEMLEAYERRPHD